MVNVKCFAPGQTWRNMIGYVQKDSGKATYKLLAHNISEEELAQVTLPFTCWGCA